MAHSLSKTLRIGAVFGMAALGGCASLDRPRLTASQPQTDRIGQLIQNLDTPLDTRAIPGSSALAGYDLPEGAQRVYYNGGESPGSILVSVGNFRLFYIEAGGTAIAYPIGAPRNNAELPPHISHISKLRPAPTWVPTANMRAKNPNLPASVAPGPNNPLGVRAINLGDTLFRIHGTNAPESIGTRASSGCIRMHNAHVIDLFERVALGGKVVVYREGPAPGITYPSTHLAGQPSRLGF